MERSFFDLSRVGRTDAAVFELVSEPHGLQILLEGMLHASRARDNHH